METPNLGHVWGEMGHDSREEPLMCNDRSTSSAFPQKTPFSQFPKGQEPPPGGTGLWATAMIRAHGFCAFSPGLAGAIGGDALVGRQRKVGLGGGPGVC